MSIEHISRGGGPEGIAIPEPPIQQTFALIKAHMVVSGRAGIVISRVLELGLTVAVATSTILSGDQIAQLYQEHVKKGYWRDLLNSVSGPCVPMVLIGPRAVAVWREALGATDSMKAAQGTLRQMFGSRTTIADNVAHGSDSREAAQRELAIFFPRSLTLHG